VNNHVRVFLARGFFIAFFVMVKISRCKDNKKNCGLRIFPLQSLHFVLLSVLFNISRTSAKILSREIPLQNTQKEPQLLTQNIATIKRKNCWH